VEVRLAERGSPDWQAGADLVHRRYSDEYDAVPYPHPDNFLIMRAVAGDGPPPVVGCAGFTYHSERSFVSERCAGRSVVELFREHLGVTVDPADVVEVGPAAGTGLGTGYEIGRLVPIVAWTQATYRAYFTSQQPVVIAIPLDSIGGLVASTTGRYRFTDLRLRLVDRHPADR
jgi:hypothetical protein